jgi:hypothetical protein
VTADQRERATRYLGNGAKLREAADMVGAAWPDFAKDWLEGRRDSEAGHETELAAWYLEARGGRSRHIAEKRAEAAAAAGSRESADLLAYVKALESEVEPLQVQEDDGPPHAVRLFDHKSPAVREAARAQLDASRNLLRALTEGGAAV